MSLVRNAATMLQWKEQSNGTYRKIVQFANPSKVP
jgi:hypothetical protein